ncbi:UvrD-like helicase C-terminal domain-containing protein [Chryseolinea serpens]|uniref:UvrD-like helicase C-terminal domain-containing protein n=1 Tax=Chryseolinea serpens TaxID=947013 RepID=A0A1M5JTP1_9BACT|nr:AAA family ATPase [Chryseolinea serpens]SHG43921.1 UvrD-like helicase C-terminal domain-containing protein [Chryseolinea serpens]
MAKSYNYRKKWIDNFAKCPLVDLDNKTYLHKTAHQLFYGKSTDDYPPEYPCDFKAFHNTIYSLERGDVLDETLKFLHFIGLTLSREALDAHLQYFPEQYHQFMKKAYYILRTIAHQNEDFDYFNPYKNNINDLLYFVDIQTGRSQLLIFEDYALPELYKRDFKIPDGYENDDVVQGLFNRIEQSNDSFFITGKAGTGKSTFIHYFSQATKKKIVKVAFTGIAAINVGGSTIHSLFRFPTKPLMPGDEEIKIFDKDHQTRKLFEDLDTIIIDEVSMLRSDVLEAIDFSLRNNGGNRAQLFGGKQILFVGDIFQLPPITVNDETERTLFSEVFRSPYFFDSEAYRELSTTLFEFKIPKRQREDLEFVELLDRIRTCDISQEDLNKINRNVDPTYIPKTDQFEIILTTINAIADRENERRLNQLREQKFVFYADVKGDFNDDRSPSNHTLELKRYAQVMFVKNDPERRWVNGTIGKIEFIANDFIEVKLADGNVHVVTREKWEHRGYKYDKIKRQITSEIKGTFLQYPLRLAWAITIHKSQGLTFDNVVIDLGSGAFVNGQLYTALSRCRRLSGIVLKRNVRKEDVIPDQRLVEFWNSISNPAKQA